MRFCLLLCLLTLGACATAPPDRPGNACEIFRQYDDWFDDMVAAEKRWGTPIAIQLAIMRKESAFQENARTPRNWFLGLVPLGRKSTAYGYAQALDGTWDWYQRKTGNSGASRDDFGDAADFIAWYAYQARKETGISKADGYKVYLAYHEGIGGFQRGTYRKKPKVRKLARKVARYAQTYARQLKKCREELEDDGWWFF